MDIDTQVKNKGGSVQYIAGNKWLCLKEMKVPDMGIHGYTFVHNVYSKGHCVVVLPFILDYTHKIRFLLRNEVIPPWSLEPSLCSITGAWDVSGESFMTTAIRELYEEAGYRMVEEDLIPLGVCHNSKATDTIFHLYAINVTDQPCTEAPGDGSELEAAATTRWCTRNEVAACDDPLASFMALRLLVLLGF